MKLKIGVCDDAAADREYLATLVRRWAKARGHAAEIATFVSAENLLFEGDGRSGCDILLLDIEMGAIDGVTLAKRLREASETVQIVFVTGYSDYISEGYDVSALHYLMKPVKEDKLFAVLDRAVNLLGREERALRLSLSDGMARVPLGRIRYVDVHLNYITVHADEDYTVKMPLRELAGSLDERFYRVGRSAIVNLTCISRVTRTEIFLSDGSVIPMPRGAYEGINRAIIGME